MQRAKFLAYWRWILKLKIPMTNLINLNDKIFIAGGNGMVGSAIKKALITKNYGGKLHGR